MEFLQPILDFLAPYWQIFTANWWLYALIPVISAAVGFSTNLMALKMMFKPTEFIGIKAPYLGWQGIVPRRAEVMATIAVDTITNKLISVQEIIDRLDPQAIADELEGPMNEIIDDIVYDVMSEHQPTLWTTMPKLLKQQVVKQVRKESPDVVAEIMQEIRQNPASVLDVKHMVVTNLKKDKHLLNRIFLDVGEPEFKFVARSGAYFGLLFGLAQMLLYLFYPANWVLPLFGLLIGYATNWIALKIIFEPREPVRVGLIKIQGLFLKRQAEVAEQYADLVANEVLTPANMFEAILTGPGSDRLFKLVERKMKKTIDESVGITMPMISMTIGSQKYQAMKASAVAKSMERAPEVLQNIEGYAGQAMDLRETLSKRLTALPPKEFEGLLRPAFEQDEWILIAVGAALGMMAGFAQWGLFAFMG